MINYKIIILTFVFVLTNLKSYSENKIFISYKIENEIITNIDIMKEANYLIALNNQLKKLTKEKILEIASQSIVKEKIKKIELLKYYQFDQKNPYIDTIVKDFYLKLNLKNLSQFENYLANYDLSIDYFKKKIEIETSWNQLIFEKFNTQINLDNELIRKRVKEMTKKNKKKSFLLSEILFEVKKNKTLEDTILEINNSIKEIGFKNTANIFSVSDSAKFGGDIGWISEDSVSKKLSKTILKLKNEEISNPIKLGNNFLLLKLENTKEIFVKIDEKKEFEKMQLFEQNRKLENFSKIYFDKIKINLNISEL